MIVRPNVIVELMLGMLASMPFWSNIISQQILQMGIEYLETEELLVDRTGIDHEFLLEIKRGKYSLKQVKDMAHNLFAITETTYNSSKFPVELDWRK